MTRFLVLRHSVRLDYVMGPAAVWEDSSTRPHDPPIVDFDLPARVITESGTPVDLGVELAS